MQIHVLESTLSRPIAHDMAKHNLAVCMLAIQELGNSYISVTASPNVVSSCRPSAAHDPRHSSATTTSTNPTRPTSRTWTCRGATSSLVFFSKPFNPVPGPTHFTMILGGTSCTWHREIKPYQPYELWTRVISWDDKWLYVVTHFVEAGMFRPDEYVM